MISNNSPSTRADLKNKNFHVVKSKLFYPYQKNVFFSVDIKYGCKIFILKKYFIQIP